MTDGVTSHTWACDENAEMVQNAQSTEVMERLNLILCIFNCNILIAQICDTVMNYPILNEKTLKKEDDNTFETIAFKTEM